MYRPLAYLAAGSAFLAPPVLLASDILLIRFISEPGLIVQRVALILFVPAIAGVAMLAPRARRPMAGGAALAVVAAAIIVYRQSWLAAPMRPPAILFPLGLLVVSGAMIRSSVPRWVATVVGAGALLFPLAHQSGVAAALVADDALLLTAFWRLAWPMAESRSPKPESQAT